MHTVLIKIHSENAPMNQMSSTQSRAWNGEYDFTDAKLTAGGGSERPAEETLVQSLLSQVYLLMTGEVISEFDNALENSVLAGLGKFLCRIWESDPVRFQKLTMCFPGPLSMTVVHCNRSELGYMLMLIVGTGIEADGKCFDINTNLQIS